jgi:CHAT domain-containing protein/tetratricopeptide (TPR) repeat protein
MHRLIATAAIFMVVACAPSTRTGVLAGSGEQAALDEATRLDQLVEKLHAEARFHDALAPAERSLMLRENALGPTHAAVAISLHNLVRVHRARAAFGVAEPLAIRALGIRENAAGLHAELAQSLNELGLLHLARGAYGKAEPLLVRALEIREKALGPMHPEVATSLHHLAELYRAQGAFAKAGPLHARALELREQVLGPMHPDVARSLAGNAGLHKDQGAYDKAEPLYVRALDITEKALGPRHPDVARSLSDLGKLHALRGAYDKAEALHARALDIFEKALGSMHPDVAQSLSDLAIVYWWQGKYGDAEALHTRALDIAENAFGPMHIDVARSSNNLAMVLVDQGAYGKAEPRFLRALEIFEQALGPAHPRVATILFNLAALYWYQGAYQNAESNLIRALDVFEKALGPMHPNLGYSLHSLAVLYHIQGAYAKAQPLYDRALDIAEKALGPTHPEVGKLLINIAGHYQDQGKYRKAEPLLVRALEICEKTLGPMHPEVAAALRGLAAIYRYQREYAKAEPLLVRSLDIFEKTLGPMHPKLALSLHALAELYWAQGMSDKAEPVLSRVAAIREDQLRIELPRLAEPRKRAVMTLLQDESDGAVSLHAHGLPRSDRALDLAVTTVLRRKGRILDSLVGSEAALRAHLTPQLRAQFDQLDRARSELVAQLYTRRDTTDRAAIAAVRTRIDELESALSAASAEFRAQSEPVTVANVQAAIPPEAALVELVRYQRFEPQKRPPSQEGRYAAYIVTRHGPVRWIALGPAAPIDARVDEMLAAMGDRVPGARAKAALRRLDALVLAPIRARLAGVSHLIIAPDGKLNLVPFEALLDERERYAMDSYLISYATTGRDLLRFAAPVQPRSPAVIVAGPDYGPLPEDAGAIKFVPLAEALGEAADLQRYFPTPPLTGEHATKSALKKLAGPAMLHVVTHGFYAQQRAKPPMPAVRGVSREMFADPNSGLPAPPRPDDPAYALDRAGLAMAGANQGPDGIVTAREIAGFDLRGTQLVVLSACETGVGAVPSGDGVYGMRRALVLAGAASQLVSLWDVDDASTRALMRDFYAELARGTGRAEALRSAKRQLMRQPRYAHPHYWAAFIPAGDWQPLDKNTIAQP